MATFTYTKPTVGGSEDTWGTTLNANWDALGTFLGSLDSAELAVLDGITSSTAELNLLDGVTVTLADITSTAAELNLLDGVTATTAEINYLSGVTGPIQAQLDGKASTATQVTSVWEAGTSTTESLVSPAKVAAAIEELTLGGVGVGQAWGTPSRVVGTSYQNTTTKPILVIVSEHQTDGVDNFFEVSTDGSTWVGVSSARQFGDWKQNHSVIIPVGSYYRLATGTFSNWAELR